MLKLAAPTRRVLILLCAALFLTCGAGFAQTACTNCLGMNLTGGSVAASIFPNPTWTADPVSTGKGFVKVTINSVPPPPATLPAGDYTGWCATLVGDAIPSTATLSATSVANLPGSVWKSINYVLNHKQGLVSDVQLAIWALVGSVSPGSLTGNALAMYNAAISPAGANFIPAPGEIIGVYLDPGVANVQDFIIEVRNPCGALGDYVWLDANNDGIQQPAEIGINGVTVKLLDFSNNVLATTVTAFSPMGGGGYYQFSGLCLASYQVAIDNGQPVLAGYLPTLTLQGGNPAFDSNLNPAQTTLTTAAPSDQTLDFGYNLPNPITLVCAGGTAEVGQVYNSSLAATGGTGGYTFSIVSGSLPPGLTLNPTTGAITGTPTAFGTYSFTAKVVDNSGSAAGTTTTNCTIVIAPPPINLVCSAGTGQMGVPYNSSLVATGGTGGYTYSIVSGTLPPGLTLNASIGAITGTPTAFGTYSFTAKVVDNSGNTAGTTTTSCTIVIAPPPLNLVCSAGTGQMGVPYSSSLVATGGTGGYTYSIVSGTLPPGLTLNSSTGAITGTPTAFGSYSFTAKVVDNSGNTAGTTTTSCTIVIAPPPINLVCASSTGVVGVPYSGSLVATGGTGGYTFSITAGALPAGLTLNASTGAITGTPLTAGTFSFTAKVTDNSGNVAGTKTANCSIVISPPPTICVPTTLDLTGNTSTTGSAGNIRTFGLSSGVQVKASAWSRTTGGTWATAYLGSYGSGLGVTDTSENGSDPQHKVDNVGRVNYVLFEFSTPVVVNRAFLDAVGADSDISVWVGTKTDPFSNHLTLSDAILASLGFTETNTIDHDNSRWADINNGNTTGNVLVIAALATDESPEDEFKIAKLDTACPQTAPCTGTIGDLVWRDANGNGIQDSGETGISGVTVQLKNGSTVIATKTTNSTGYYQFTGLCPGTYTVVVTPPSGYAASPNLVGSNRAIDSNANPSTVTLTTAAPSDQTIDFGFVPPPAPVCVPTTFDLTGSTPSSGGAGNIRTITAPTGVKVNASAWSRTTGGTWAKAYLGSYSSGLGVTDTSEDGSDPKHKVDNIGRINYVLFEFSTPVVVNKAFLDSVGADSDISVWVGTKTDPFNNHLTLSDALLASLALSEENVTTSSNSRWADLNAGGVAGNVLVIAALADDDTPEDEFKISKLDIVCAPAVACTGSIGNFVWKDTNGNGIQDSGEPGIPGVTVQLKNGSTVIATATTDANGYYQFKNLCAGSYTVVIPTTPSGYMASPSLAGTNRSNDSNGSPASVTLTANNSSDQSIDFGFKPGGAVCLPATLDLTGNTSATGTVGNIRTFGSSSGVQVKASAWSRTSGGTWAAAYLGSYSSGLGATDTSEDGSDPAHRVDNKGRINYMLFEFSAPVVVNKAFLDSVGADSDISVWIGTKTDPFNNHVTLGDALLTSLGAVEENMASNGDSRWADINSANKVGNVVVIAASASDTTPDDEFKIKHLDIKCQ